MDDFAIKKISKKGGGIWKDHMVSKGVSRKSMLGPQGGRGGGQKVLKIGPHGLWMTPNYYYAYYTTDYLSR